MADSKPKRISISFPPDLADTVAALAQSHERSLNGEVIWLLRRALAWEVFRRSYVDGQVPGDASEAEAVSLIGQLDALLSREPPHE